MSTSDDFFSHKKILPISISYLLEWLIGGWIYSFYIFDFFWLGCFFRILEFRILWASIIQILAKKEKMKVLCFYWVNFGVPTSNFLRDNKEFPIYLHLNSVAKQELEQKTNIESKFVSTNHEFNQKFKKSNMFKLFA
jgi:hypothetical protein